MKYLPSHNERLCQQRILHNWRLRDVAEAAKQEHGLWMMPYARNPHFIGHDDLLTKQPY